MVRVLPKINSHTCASIAFYLNFLATDLATLEPSTAAPMLPTLLAVMYPKARDALPLSNRAMESTANVENVVKPPQSPTPSNNFARGAIGEDAAITPSTKLPKIFTVNVPKYPP